MYLVAGSNLFGQWLSENRILNSFQDITSEIKKKNLNNLDNLQILSINWSYNVIKINNTFYLVGSWHGKNNQFTKVSLPEECTNCDASDSDLIIAGNDYNLLLVNTKTRLMWVKSLESEAIKKINLNVETPLPTNAAKRMKRDDTILKVITNNNSCVYLTTEGMVYSGVLPSHLDTSHCEGKVCDVQCGYEHFVLLTDTGRVYTWGNGRRLQLGHGDITNQESPTEVEALAGIKMVKMCTGGWHTLALSEFGDLYVWGWNDTGQLGIKSQPELKESGVLKNDGLRSYPLPTLVDIFDENDQEIILNVKDIGCGSKHSAILLEDNTVWTTGYNKYGQLGLSPETYPTVNYFKKSFQGTGYVELMCGPWSTILVNK